MALRMLIDAGDVAATDVTLLGARNLDPPEAAFIALAGVRTSLGELPADIYVALDLDVGDPAELDVFFPEPDGMPAASIEELLASLPPPRGAGFSGFVASERNALALARFGHALGM